MKRFTMTLALLLMAAMPMTAERVTPENAQKAAKTFLNNNGAKAAQLTDLSKAAGFANLYIFTAEQGFVVMAADDCVQPILGYSLTGTFVAENMPDNVRGWLQGYSNEIQWGIDNQVRASSETAKQWKDLIDGNAKAGKATTVVAPLIQTKWNQDKYYNNLCPAVSDGPDGKANTGCVATAMAQIMKFWNYPSKGIGSNSYPWKNQILSANFGETTYDWDNMADYYEYYFPNGTDNYPTWLPDPSETEIAAVATLMYHCGVSIDMEYGGRSTGGSSASTSDVATALKTYFNYNPNLEYIRKSYTNTNGSDNPTNWEPTEIFYEDDVWIALLKAELDVPRPMVYRGADPGSIGGHSFVCDGYDDQDYFHFNWGWAGDLNGYFTITNLNTGANSQSGAGNGTYTRDQAAIFGIRPSNNNSVPSNLDYTLDGNNLTLTWNAATGVESYNVYRNGNLVGYTNGTTYSETAPFGTNEYYVRSVDASGELSLSSITVEVTVVYLHPVVDDLSATYSQALGEAYLSWTAPEWCYPETPSETLTHGTQIKTNAHFKFDGTRYWGHRHLAENISSFNDLRLYSVDFYAHNEGAYRLCIYEGTNNGAGTTPSNQVCEQDVPIASTGWNTINLTEPYYIDGSKDLWVFIKNEMPFDDGLEVYLCDSEGTTEGGYYSGNPLSYTNPTSGYAFLIKTYLTDGTYTYNLYRDGAEVAKDITRTTYNAPLNINAPNVFTVKTNYYGGETEGSNKVGFAKGTASLNIWETTAENDKMTVTEGSILTINTHIYNPIAANLVLENRAQLIHNAPGVEGTVKKKIARYSSNNDGWYFIAPPVMGHTTPSEENGLITNNYDLYWYEEPTHLWKNYRNASFALSHGKGYLYANGNDTELLFEGTLDHGNSNSMSMTGLSHSAETLNGFNLIGNPFPCNATVDQECYVISGRRVVLAETNPTLAPCEGVMVKADSDDYTVTFTRASGAKASGKGKSLDLVVTEGGVSAGSTTAILDRARVRLGEGTNMEKFTLEGNASTQLTLWKDGQDFAVAYTDGQNNLPLNFKAAENGTYSISIEANSLDVDYLHLIDNMTGADIDLLTMPNYTFEATTTDYASRFRLVFSNDDASTGSASDATFAYVSNGNIVITADARGASLQVVDVMGRVLVCRDASNASATSVSVAGMPAGVYVLRLIDGDNVRTQKIVIE